MTAGITAADIDLWRRDPCAFIETVLHDPETNLPYKLHRAQRRFVRRAFSLTPDGRLRYPELVFSGPKKSGKTALAAMLVIDVVVIPAWPVRRRDRLFKQLGTGAGQGVSSHDEDGHREPKASEGRCGYHDNQDHVFAKSTSGTIIALASDFTTAAGANPSITCFDELWGYVSERDTRLFDEMVPSPARRISCRLTVSYAGYEGESSPLESLYKRVASKAGRSSLICMRATDC